MSEIREAVAAYHASGRLRAPEKAARPSFNFTRLPLQVQIITLEHVSETRKDSQRTDS